MQQLGEQPAGPEPDEPQEPQQDDLLGLGKIPRPSVAAAVSEAECRARYGYTRAEIAAAWVATLQRATHAL